MLALLAQGPHLENTGYTTRPNTAAATGMPLHTLVLIVGPYAAGGQRLLRRLLSSLRHVCLFSSPSEPDQDVRSRYLTFWVLT